MLNAFDPEIDTLIGRKPLEGRSAIVTGSTSGIGLGIAHALARSGAAVMLNGFGDPAEIETLRADIAGDNDVDVAYDAADMTKPEAIRMMVERAVARFGQVDIVVNNAGIQHVSPIGKFPSEKWDAILAINLSAAFHLVQSTFDGMCARGYGRIINVASAHGLVASPFKSAYVAAKHGIVGFTKTIALEGAEFGVTSNAICPGYVWTPLVEHQIEDQAKSHKIARDAVIREVFLKDQPTKRFATVEEMGALAVFLCGDLAGSITGTAIPVDGGWTAH
ncbi:MULTISPECIES: 3-hydroxybutyrate dehydrogenase [Rhizobium]|uniref:3-hydroxybutyrate dehydrogenase n=1 Tax=Rhizobium lentis TaxID=1138194 RepID=A0A7W8XDG7_9HYPH|nr:MULTISPECIES: 3-hydroxybutyrate dehydrogenase [Rhizobium]MBB4573401.1 3-hydroxybutyrate dehydrogenase [Rhizobium lentis]MBB5549329.1 3-hydroxybutyrate dehydrogenase [Rhizobium lentis]MBB5559864.1 3-hydroxybutyrate dehydrogenase [Rhizobium lentis]MBB5566253.1 3-hydroxybutyrate dehydrogenase [Rhizobium lentis]MEB3042853.1 3-hydroxybutyrate dehydrogenase [Rhizobium sp. MJ21]